jgi:hypothetical protein
MINNTLIFLKNILNEYLRSKDGINLEHLGEDRVVFIDGDKLEPISFKLETITLLLINLEEENTLRQADPYIRTSNDGSTVHAKPEIRLNLYVLFIAKFKQYESSLEYISDIIKFFQSNRLFTQQNSPALNEKIEKLYMELITLPFSEQNEIWNALRTTYHPSVLYKVKMLVYKDEEILPTSEISRGAVSATEKRK